MTEMGEKDEGNEGKRRLGAEKDCRVQKLCDTLDRADRRQL